MAVFIDYTRKSRKLTYEVRNEERPGTRLHCTATIALQSVSLPIYWILWVIIEWSWISGIICFHFTGLVMNWHKYETNSEQHLMTYLFFLLCNIPDSSFQTISLPQYKFARYPCFSSPYVFYTALQFWCGFIHDTGECGLLRWTGYDSTAPTTVCLPFYEFPVASFTWLEFVVQLMRDYPVWPSYLQTV